MNKRNAAVVLAAAMLVIASKERQRGLNRIIH